MTRRAKLAFAALLLAAGTFAGCAREPAPDTAAAEADEADAAPSVEAAAPAPAPPAAVASNAKPTAVQETSGGADGDAESAPTRSEASLERLTQLPAQDQLPAGKWQVGKNYNVLTPAQPTNVGPGKVEVVEVFWFGCSHCYALDPYLESWKKNKPSFIEFVRVPVMWGAPHRAHAKLFYTLQALGKEEALHNKVFDAIQRGGNMLAANDEQESFRIQLAWAKANGIAEADFTREYNGFFVTSAIQRAEQLTRRYRVEGVPLMIINGKYSADVGSAGGQGQLISLINDLAASEKRR
ncbi:MAG: thiol:disulfide interchange protein DsbA/DsbL [Steroidobacteraceae bacterium]